MHRAGSSLVIWVGPDRDFLSPKKQTTKMAMYKNTLWKTGHSLEKVSSPCSHSHLSLLSLDSLAQETVDGDY